MDLSQDLKDGFACRELVSLWLVCTGNSGTHAGSSPEGTDTVCMYWKSYTREQAGRAEMTGPESTGTAQERLQQGQGWGWGCGRSCDAAGGRRVRGDGATEETPLLPEML